MAKAFQLAVVAPDRSVVDESVVSVIAPGAAGYFGVLSGHVPFVAALRPGLVEYEDEQSQRRFITVSGGFAEVSEDKVTILADAAERAEEIDVARAERALEEAREALAGRESGQTTQEAVSEMERAVNRLRAAQKL